MNEVVWPATTSPSLSSPVSNKPPTIYVCTTWTHSLRYKGYAYERWARLLHHRLHLMLERDGLWNEIDRDDKKGQYHHTCIFREPNHTAWGIENMVRMI